MSNSISSSASKGTPNAIQDFEDVLNKIGGWGRFQKMQLLICFSLTFLLSYVCYSPILFLYVPEHWCSVDAYDSYFPGLNQSELVQLLIPLDDDGNKMKCSMYNITQVLNEEETLQTIPCDSGWEYNFEDYFHTASTDMNWVCEDSWKPMITQGSFFLGGIIGTIIFGYTADHLGRKWTFIASNVVIMLSGLATPFCTTFFTFCLIRFIMGLSNLTYYTVFFILTLEYVSIEKRSLVANLSLAIGLTLGGLYQPWLMKALGYWKIYHHILYLQTLLILIAPWFVQESIRWLASRGKIEDCFAIMEKIANQNGKTLDTEFFNNFKQMVLDQKVNEEMQPKPDIFSLFKTPRLRKNTILMAITWMMIAGMFDGHIRNISNLNYSIYITFTISVALELPADLLAIWGLNFLGRRWSAFFSLVLSTSCMFACAIFHEFANLVTIFAMCGRFFITYAMNTGVQMSFEIVPTVLRGQGSALVNVFAQASQFFSPFIVYSGVYSPVLSFLILGVGALIGAVSAIFLPETADEDLPDTIEEAENFGKNQKFFHMPCLKKQPSKDLEK